MGIQNTHGTLQLIRITKIYNSFNDIGVTKVITKKDEQNLNYQQMAEKMLQKCYCCSNISPFHAFEAQQKKKTANKQKNKQIVLDLNAGNCFQNNIHIRKSRQYHMITSTNTIHLTRI